MSRLNTPFSQSPTAAAAAKLPAMIPRLVLFSLAAVVSAPAHGQEPPPTPAADTAPVTLAPEAPKPEEKVVVMEPFRVRGNAVGNFAISVQVFINKDTGRMQLFVSKVTPGSDAERLGLRAGDEIIRIGGHVVADLEPDVGRDSVLGKLLLNRKSGEILDLEYVTRQPRAVKLRASSVTGVSITRPDPKVEVPAPKPARTP